MRIRLLPRRLVGPIFGFELVRLARRGQHTRLRAGLALALLVTLFVVYANFFPESDPLRLLFSLDVKMPINEMGRFAERFAHALLFVQLVAVVILTPVYAAGSVTEEIQRRSLEHLLATDLSSSEIVLGKMLARTLYVAGILLTGLPILALAQLWGGVDMGMLLRSYAVIGCTLASLAGLSLWFAVESRELRPALLRVYALVGGLTVGTFCLSCFGPVLMLGSPFHVLVLNFVELDRKLAVGMTIGCCAIHLTVAVIGVATAIHGLRGRDAVPLVQAPDELISGEGRQVYEKVAERWRELRLAVAGEAARGEAAEEPIPLPAGRDPPDWSDRPVWAPLPWRPPIGDDPLLWKETHVRPGSVWNTNPGVMTCLTSAALVVGGMLFMFLIIATANLLGKQGELADLYNPLARWLGLGLLACWLVAAGLHAAGGVSRERERQTLDTLLTIPSERRAILVAKWRAAFAAGRGFRNGLMVLLGVATIAGGLSVLAIPLLAVLALSLLGLVVSLGLWISVRCQNSFRASAYLVIVLVAIAGVPLVLAEFVEAAGRAAGGSLPGLSAREVTTTISPAAAWVTLTFPHDFPAKGGDRSLTLFAFIGALACAVLSILASRLCWLGACRRFEAEGRT